ncbi:MAG: hypothetical protein VYE57_08995 [SAR324 cluster bacterium]|nr:hypothetical protein [SAR324 cluster bacterium]
MDVPHISVCTSSAGDSIDENLALQFEMSAAGLMGRLQLMNAIGTQRPSVKGPSLGE